MIIGLVACSRQRFYYYGLIYLIYMAIMAYFKLAYADPRPYFLSYDIKPWGCTSNFGNPSGHSSAAATFGFCFFLDLFHGSPICKCYVSATNWVAYTLTLAFGIYWAVTIPYTRFLVGVHSLD